MSQETDNNEAGLESESGQSETLFTETASTAGETITGGETNPSTGEADGDGGGKGKGGAAKGKVTKGSLIMFGIFGLLALLVIWFVYMNFIASGPPAQPAQQAMPVSQQQSGSPQGAQSEQIADQKRQEELLAALGGGSDQPGSQKTGTPTKGPELSTPPTPTPVTPDVQQQPGIALPLAGSAGLLGVPTSESIVPPGDIPGPVYHSPASGASVSDPQNVTGEPPVSVTHSNQLATTNNEDVLGGPVSGTPPADGTDAKNESGAAKTGAQANPARPATAQGAPEEGRVVAGNTSGQVEPTGQATQDALPDRYMTRAAIKALLLDIKSGQTNENLTKEDLLNMLSRVKKGIAGVEKVQSMLRETVDEVEARLSEAQKNKASADAQPSDTDVDNKPAQPERDEKNHENDNTISLVKADPTSEKPGCTDVCDGSASSDSRVRSDRSGIVNKPSSETCILAAVVPDRAWIKNSDGTFTTYGVMDMAPNGARITKINPDVGIVTENGSLHCRTGL